jgi:hypothetical protein
MQYRFLVPSASVLALAAATFQGCGSSREGGGVSADGGGSDAADVVSREAAATETGFPEAGPNCGAAPPSGQQLVASPTAIVNGVTSDGHVIYTDTAAHVLYAVPLGGGTPTNIGALDSANLAFVAGNVVYFSSLAAVVGPLSVGSLSAWTATGGAANLSAGAILPAAGATPFRNGIVDVTADGLHILYAVRPAGSNGVTLMVATTDGKTQIPLLSNIDVSSASCVPFAMFGGSDVVVAYCFAPPAPGVGAAEAGVADGGSSGSGSVADGAVSDGAMADGVMADGAPADGAAGGASQRDDGGEGAEGGPPPAVATIASFTGAGFTETTLASKVEPKFAVDNGATHVLVSDTSALDIFPITGGAPLTIESSSATGIFTPDGMNILYGTVAKALKRASVTMASAVTLVPSGLSGVAVSATGQIGLSPDGSWLVAYQAQDLTNGTSDLYLASATTPGTATPLSTMPSGGLFGDVFTADSKYVLYALNAGTGTGDFYVMPASGGTATKVASGMWQEWTTAGSKVVVSVNCVGCTPDSGVADLEAVDAANPTTTTQLVGQADANFFLSAAKDKLVYSWKCSKASTAAGVWAMPTP